MKSTRISSLVLLFLLISVTKEKDSEMKGFIPNEKNVKFLGRAIMIEDVLFLGYSNSGAEFKVKASRLDITIAGDSGAAGVVTDSSARIAVFVDDERVVDEMIAEKKQTFTVFSEDKAKESIIRVLKISECSQSMVGLVSIDVDSEGSISPTKAKDLKIEVIGDSITCGYGIDDPDRDHHFKTSTEDSSKTYFYKAAKILNADYSVVAVSGAGVISSYSGNGERQIGNLVPSYYTKLGFSWGNTFMGVKPQDEDWDFNLFVPNFIVINLGTNDNSYTKGNADKEKEFQDAYVEFLGNIRKNNKDATIICSLGIMGQDLFHSIEKAVDKYKSKSGDEKVTTLKFDVQNMNEDGIAADWHPTEKTNIKASKLLASTIQELMG